MMHSDWGCALTLEAGILIAALHKPCGFSGGMKSSFAQQKGCMQVHIFSVMQLLYMQQEALQPAVDAPSGRTPMIDCATSPSPCLF
jgi:hypothetical protein